VETVIRQNRQVFHLPFPPGAKIVLEGKCLRELEGSDGSKEYGETVGALQSKRPDETEKERYDKAKKPWVVSLWFVASA